MKVLSSIGEDHIARVYLAETEQGKLIELAESVQPGCPIEKKWVLCISTLYGCPVDCLMCDAGGSFHGKLTTEEMLAQINYLVRRRFPSGQVPVEKFKIQFARMGEPSFNLQVLDLLEILHNHINAPGLIPSFSTIAPEGTDSFFQRLLDVKQRRYAGQFQFQFSLHTSDPEKRRWLIPIKTWDFTKMAQYGELFHQPGDRKITLNFALAEGMPLDATVLRNYFNPDIFLVKITPVNPTFKAVRSGLSSVLPQHPDHPDIINLREAGYEVILSIGDLAENGIGSNCGQYVTAQRLFGQTVPQAYQYSFNPV